MWVRREMVLGVVGCGHGGFKYKGFGYDESEHKDVSIMGVHNY